MLPGGDPPVCSLEDSFTQPPIEIVSNNAANAVLNRVVVVPLTGQTAKVYPGEAMVSINGRPSKAMADQIATVAKVRLSKRIGRLSASDMSLVEQALRVQLALV